MTQTNDGQSGVLPESTLEGDSTLDMRPDPDAGFAEAPASDVEFSEEPEFADADADSFGADSTDVDFEFQAAEVEEADFSEMDETVPFMPAVSEAAFGDDDDDGEIIDLEVADEEDEGSGRGNIAGTVASVILHVWLLMNLAQMTIEEDPYYYVPPIESRIVENKPQEEEIEVVNYELADPNDRDHEVREVVNAASVGMAQTDKPKIESQPRPLHELIPEARQANVYDIPEGVEVDEKVVVKGTTGEAMVQLESALDRVTWEIAKNLQESKVLVVWLLDASGSLDKQKQIIAKRLQRVYGELDALQQTDQIPRHEKPLLSGVVTFGSKTSFITPNPTEKFEEIHKAILEAPADETGVENVFTAVSQVSTNWARYRTQQFRRTMLVLVTDEAGDDFEPKGPQRPGLEKAIKLCQRYGTKAYVIGPSAVFGRRKGFVPYVAPENGQEYRLPIDLGPESMAIEMVDLPYWYDGPDLTYLSSGFAPYALARLVHETGGVYFMTNMTTMSGLSPVGVFDYAALKQFAPNYNYGSPKEYQDDVTASRLRWSVVRASFRSREHQPNGTPQMSFAVTPQNFKTVAGDAQKTAAQSQLQISQIEAEFPSGIEGELDREPSMRWRANFCLSYGRVLAQKIRNMEYNAALAFLKNELAAEDVAKTSNRWRISASRELNFAGNQKKTAAKATALLQRVIDEAPGTPWAVLAQRELQYGFGLKIKQSFVPPPPPRPRNNNPNNTPRKRVLFAAEQRKPAAPKKIVKPKPPVLPKL